MHIGRGEDLSGEYTAMPADVNVEFAEKLSNIPVLRTIFRA